VAFGGQAVVELTLVRFVSTLDEEVEGFGKRPFALRHLR
jgi:hypothetical protein